MSQEFRKLHFSHIQNENELMKFSHFTIYYLLFKVLKENNDVTFSSIKLKIISDGLIFIPFKNILRKLVAESLLFC